MYDSALRAAQRAPVRAIFAGVALVASVCALFEMVVAAQQSQLVTMARPTSQAPHAYFDGLAARPERKAAYSLRAQAQLNALVKRGPSTFFQYVWPGDNYARPQDAAKLVKPPKATFPPEPYGALGDENIPGQETLRIPVGITSGRFVITWDFWWGEEFQTNRGTVDAFKTFFLTTGVNIGGSNFFWLGHDVLGSDVGTTLKPGEVSKHHEGPVGERQAPKAPGVIRSDPYQPTGLGAMPMRSFVTMSNRWTRYWLEVRMDVPGSAFTDWSRAALSGAPLEGTWDMVSLWIADEQRDPVRVLYRVPAPRVDPMFAEFRLAFDTSTNNLNGGGLTGPYIGYARNVVILHNADLHDTSPVFTYPVGVGAPMNLRIIR